MGIFIVIACVLYGVGLLGAAGVVFMAVRRPDMLEQCQHYQEAAAQKCGDVFVKAKAKAKTWFGRH